MPIRIKPGKESPHWPPATDKQKHAPASGRSLDPDFPSTKTIKAQQGDERLRASVPQYFTVILGGSNIIHNADVNFLVIPMSPKTLGAFPDFEQRFKKTCVLQLLNTNFRLIKRQKGRDIAKTSRICTFKMQMHSGKKVDWTHLGRPTMGREEKTPDMVSILVDFFFLLWKIEDDALIQTLYNLHLFCSTGFLFDVQGLQAHPACLSWFQQKLQLVCLLLLSTSFWCICWVQLQIPAKTGLGFPRHIYTCLFLFHTSCLYNSVSKWHSIIGVKAPFMTIFSWGFSYPLLEARQVQLEQQKLLLQNGLALSMSHL